MERRRKRIIEGAALTLDQTLIDWWKRKFPQDPRGYDRYTMPELYELFVEDLHSKYLELKSTLNSASGAIRLQLQKQVTALEDFLKINTTPEIPDDVLKALDDLEKAPLHVEVKKPTTSKLNRILAK